ncbi:MAG: hypothetical protein PHE25_04850, partial [Candidatus Gracilibacteria bacterium]|nr:hypothetical protein [Candidatus Gracilibacteria bacterium]
MKRNKIKIIISIIITIFLNISIAFGDCSKCKIKDGPPVVLENYVKDLRKVISNISSKIANYNKDLTAEQKSGSLEKDFIGTKSKIIGIFNKIIDWDSYFIDIDFYVVYATINDYVYEIWRDYNELDSEGKGLSKYLKYASDKGYSFDLTKDEICKGITSNCDFEGNILDVLGEIIKNNEYVKNYYKLSILGNTNGFDTKKIKLVSQDSFAKDFDQYYNKSTTPDCSSCGGGSFDAITKEIDKIVNWQKNAENGIKTWKEALALLNGSYSNSYEEKILV